jgi:hypothetical protein
MANSFIYDLAMALIPGAVAGYYVGLLMAKHAKFNSLKHEALRCIRRIDYLPQGHGSALREVNWVKELPQIASELFHLKHRRAGEDLMAIATRASQLANGGHATAPIGAVQAQVEDWQRRVRQMRPGWRYVLPWGQI